MTEFERLKALQTFQRTLVINWTRYREIDAKALHQMIEALIEDMRERYTIYADVDQQSIPAPRAASVRHIES